MKNKTAFLTATWFKTGLIPSFLPMEMGGTYGSFFALPLCIGIVLLTRFLTPTFGFLIAFIPYWAITSLIFLAGEKSVPITEKVLGARRDHKGKMRDRDQNCIVIDEVLGMLIACILFTNPTLSLRWEYFLYAFLLFRFFDIVKIPPSRYFDRMKNAFGVMMDDVVAGFYAGMVLGIIVIFY